MLGLVARLTHVSMGHFLRTIVVLHLIRIISLILSNLKAIQSLIAKGMIDIGGVGEGLAIFRVASLMIILLAWFICSTYVHHRRHLHFALCKAVMLGNCTLGGARDGVWQTLSRFTKMEFPKLGTLDFTVYLVCKLADVLR